MKQATARSCSNCMHSDYCEDKKGVCTRHTTFTEKRLSMGFRNKEEWEAFCEEWRQAVSRIHKKCKKGKR